MTAEKPVVVVTRPPLPPEVDQRVNRDFRPRIADTSESLTPDGLLALADGASALLVTGADRLDADFFDHIPRSVKIVATRRLATTTSTYGPPRATTSPFRTPLESSPTPSPSPTRPYSCCWAPHATPTSTAIPARRSMGPCSHGGPARLTVDRETPRDLLECESITRTPRRSRTTWRTARSTTGMRSTCFE